MSYEFYKRYRPKSLSDVVGQPEVCKVLQNHLDNGTTPHTCLFYGPSGTGKTTIARIIARAIGSKSHDLQEYNSADLRGLDDVRAIRDDMWSRPMHGKTKTWILDEIHGTNNFFQEAFLKMCEDTPDQVYFFLATTHPQKIIPTLKNRCALFEIKPVSAKLIQKRLEFICKEEKVETPSSEVMDTIAEMSEGSLRLAIQTLEKVLKLKTDDEQLAIICNTEEKKEIIHLCRKLLDPRSKWAEVSKIIKGLEIEPESARYTILAYMGSVLLGGGKLAGRARAIIGIFEDTFMYTKKAGLSAACYDVICPPKD